MEAGKKDKKIVKMAGEQFFARVVRKLQSGYGLRDTKPVAWQLFKDGRILVFQPNAIQRPDEQVRVRIRGIGALSKAGGLRLWCSLKKTCCSGYREVWRFPARVQQ